MNYDVLFYPVEASTGRPMEFTLSSSLIGCFLHDIEKPWKEEQELRTDAEKMVFRRKRPACAGRFFLLLSALFPPDQYWTGQSLAFLFTNVLSLFA